MKFLKTTLLGGLFVLLPLMLLWIGIKEIGGLLEAMATGGRRNSSLQAIAATRLEYIANQCVLIE